MVKNPLAIREIWVRSLGWEGPPEEGMATQSTILAWRISMVRGIWWATVHGVAESDMTEGHSTAQPKQTGPGASDAHSVMDIRWQTRQGSGRLCAGPGWGVRGWTGKLSVVGRTDLGTTDWFIGYHGNHQTAQPS